jgi:hypothetical protein
MILYHVTLEFPITEMKEIPILSNGITSYLTLDVNSKFLDR